MIVQRLRATVVTDPYSDLPTGEDWATPQITDMPGHLVGWQDSAENPTVNRAEIANQGMLLRPGGVAEVEVLTTDRIRALGHDWNVDGHGRQWEYADLLGVGLISGPDAGTVWNLTRRDG